MNWAGSVELNNDLSRPVAEPDPARVAAAAVADPSGAVPAADGSIGGRAMVVGGSEFSCRARNMTLHAVELSAEAKVEPGQVVVCYLDEIGILPGTVARTMPDGFVLSLAIPESRRIRVAARMEWHADRAQRAAELRGAPRIVPNQRKVQVRLGEQLAMTGQILNVSMSGVAIALRTQALPFVGAKVRVGSRYGTVVRLLENGIAVQFAVPFASEDFDETVLL